MESAIRGRLTAAADGVDDGHRRFNPNHPPPHGGVADPAPADMAALSFKREVLLQELHKQRILQEMIMRELTETERAIAIATGNRSSPTPVMPPWPPGRDAWRGRLSTPASREEQVLRAPRLSETTTPWWCRSPSEPVVPPVYPHVERSPSPVREQRLVDGNAKQQQELGGSSGPPAVAPPVRPGLTPCQPLIKEPATVEESLLPALTNAIAKPTETDLLSKEATQEDQAAVGQEREAEGKNSNRVKAMESGIQRSEQPEHAAVGKEPKTEAMDGHAVQLMESGTHSSEQSKPAEPTTEHRISELRRSPSQYTLGGKEKSPSDEQKRLEFNENFPLKRRLLPAATVIPSPEKKLKPEQKWSGAQLSQASPAWERNLALRREAQLHWPPQPMQKPAEPVMKPSPESSHGAHQQQSSSEKKSQNQNDVPGAAAGGSRTSKWSGDIGQARAGSGFDLRSHLVLGGRRRQDQNTVVASSSSQSHAEEEEGNNGEELASRRAYDDRKDEDLRKTLAKKRLRQHVCEICDVQCTSEKNLESHLGGKRHREMMLQGRH